MSKLYVDIYNARKYTDVFYDYLIDNGYAKENDTLLSLLYWLSDDDVREYAVVNYDIEFIEDDYLEEEGDDSE